LPQDSTDVHNGSNEGYIRCFCARSNEGYIRCFCARVHDLEHDLVSMRAKEKGAGAKRKVPKPGWLARRRKSLFCIENA